jgi:hypothetical protein
MDKGDRDPPVRRWTSKAGLRLGASIIGSLLAVACGQGAPSSQEPSPSPGISIPAEQLPPDIRCLVEHGATIVEVKPPLISGDPPRYELTLDLPPSEARRISVECQKLASPHPERTEAEIRAIYERWVNEYRCLLDLGYQPDPPPSVETFVAQWRGSGPWTPIDGIDVGAWSDDEYREAKSRCGLEFYERD